jgi:hypothetical protein
MSEPMISLVFSFRKRTVTEPYGSS